MYIIGKLAKIRDVYGSEAYNKKEELRDQMLKLAKIHYATID